MKFKHSSEQREEEVPLDVILQDKRVSIQIAGKQVVALDIDDSAKHIKLSYKSGCTWHSARRDTIDRNKPIRFSSLGAMI